MDGLPKAPQSDWDAGPNEAKHLAAAAASAAAERAADKAAELSAAANAAIWASVEQMSVGVCLGGAMLVFFAGKALARSLKNKQGGSGQTPDRRDGRRPREHRANIPTAQRRSWAHAQTVPRWDESSEWRYAKKTVALAWAKHSLAALAAASIEQPADSHTAAPLTRRGEEEHQEERQRQWERDRHGRGHGRGRGHVGGSGASGTYERRRRSTPTADAGVPTGGGGAASAQWEASVLPRSPSGEWILSPPIASPVTPPPSTKVYIATAAHARSSPWAPAPPASPSGAAAPSAALSAAPSADLGSLPFNLVELILDYARPQNYTIVGGSREGRVSLFKYRPIETSATTKPRASGGSGCATAARAPPPTLPFASHSYAAPFPRTPPPARGRPRSDSGSEPVPVGLPVGAGGLGHSGWVYGCDLGTKVNGHDTQGARWQWMVSASRDYTVRSWKVGAGHVEAVKVMHGHTSWVYVCRISLDQRTVHSGSEDGAVKCWNLRTGRCEATLLGQGGGVYCIFVGSGPAPPADPAVAGAEPPTGTSTTPATWAVNPASCQGDGAGALPVAGAAAAAGEDDVPEDEGWIATGSGDKCVRIWAWQRRRVSSTSTSVGDGASSWLGSVSGRSAADGTRVVWRCVRMLRGHEKAVYNIAGPKHASRRDALAGLTSPSAPDRQWIASGSNDGSIRVWSTHDWSCIRVLRPSTEWINALVVTPDGRALVSGGGERALRVWDTRSWTCSNVLPGHTDYVSCLQVSNDGAVVSSGSADRTIRLWTTDTWRCSQALKVKQWVHCCAITADEANTRVVL